MIVIILILALLLRTINLSTNPPELYHDELINYVSAKSILETGKDLDGKLLPYFSDRVEFRPPLYGYLSYLSTKLLGESAFAIRFPAVILGLSAIFLLYLLIIELLKNKQAALLASFSMAIIPWHIHYSRIGWEPAPLLTLLLAGLVFFIKGITLKKHKFIFLGFILFGLLIYTYHGAPLFSLIFLVILIISNYKFFFKNKRIVFFGIFIYLLTITPFLKLAYSEPNFWDRAKRISTFANGISPESISIFFNNYFAHFSFNFLFINGDPNLRHGAQTGVLYLWMVPFILLGLYYILFKDKKIINKLLVAFWLIIFPLGGAITNDGVPHAHRTLIGIPLFSLLSGVGIWFAYQKIYSLTKSKIIQFFFIISLGILVFYSLRIFAIKYFTIYPTLSQFQWYYGHKDVFSKIKTIEKTFKRVCLGHLNYWEAKPIVKYYLKDSNLIVYEGTDNPKCLESKSIISQPFTNPKPANSKLVFITFNLNHKPLYSIYTIN